METTVWNPQKGRLETIDVKFTKENTTWFDDCEDSHGIFSITDLQGGLLIKEADYTYPLYVYDIYRADIGHDHGRARAAHSQYQLEGGHSPPSDTQVIRRSPIGRIRSSQEANLLLPLGERNLLRLEGIVRVIGSQNLRTGPWNCFCHW